MSVFDGLLSDLFRQTEPEELTGAQAQQRVEATGRSVSQRIDDFAGRYLASDTYERYRDRLEHLRYNVADLPSRVITFFNMFTGRIRRYVDGALGLYDEERNRITVNRAVATDIGNGQLEPVMGHERVHHATREWLRTYFKRFGEKARPVVEGFTELITRGLGYDSGAYPELVYAAHQTLSRLGNNIQDVLYGILNYHIDPETVLDTFYQSLGLQQRQPVYALARAR